MFAAPCPSGPSPPRPASNKAEAHERLLIPPRALIRAQGRAVPAQCCPAGTAGQGMRLEHDDRHLPETGHSAVNPIGPIDALAREAKSKLHRRQQMPLVQGTRRRTKAGPHLRPAASPPRDFNLRHRHERDNYSALRSTHHLLEAPTPRSSGFSAFDPTFERLVEVRG